MKNPVKRLLKAAGCVILAAVILLLPPTRLLESMAVMGIYSEINKNESVLKDEGIKISIPGGMSTAGNDWYPFVMTFNSDEGFSRYIGREGTRLSILYNFAQFDFLKGCSRLYDKSSPLYSSFYGAYAVKTSDGEPYGFIKEGESYILDADSTALVPKYDYHRLVLSDFGLRDDETVFEWNITEEEKGLSYLGYDGWTRIDAEMEVNGCAHKAEGFKTSYLQYGVPNFEVDNDLEKTKMFGRVYARYFPEKDISIFMYVLTADENELEKCDGQILSNTKIAF